MAVTGWVVLLVALNAEFAWGRLPGFLFNPGVTFRDNNGSDRLGERLALFNLFGCRIDIFSTSFLINCQFTIHYTGFGKY
ncbi:hypothetical protein [Siminovitchia fortis]|uniref:hypothetical protein n=1 Tax=Siminovitchia fortis TaxID=254758 RepID=UPI0021B46EA9|nr:hypothetical protein [Siminovitchia fortis]